MSYDIKLTRPNNNRIVDEQQVVESDNNTVILNRSMNNSTSITVRINDFKRDRNFQTEKLVREEVTDQFNGNTDTIFVKQGPIYDGLKVGNITDDPNDVIVKIRIVEEDVSGQLTGNEDYFVLEGRPILRDNAYDFNSFITKSDVTITVNGEQVVTQNIVDINSKSGRIQLTFVPEATDTVLVTYCFSAKIKELDAVDGRIILKEKPKPGQVVRVQYYSRVNDGWYLKTSERSLVENATDVVFFERKNTNREFVEQDNLTPQVTGENNEFYVSNAPLLPLYQDFSTTTDETLNNAIVVTVDGNRAQVLRVDAEAGKIAIEYNPPVGSIVLASYYFQNEWEPDRISIDYNVPRNQCEQCTKHISLADYRVDQLGNYEIVRNEDKLIQDLKKIVITSRGTDPIATWYGTNFQRIISTKLFPEVVKTQIASEIIEALNRLKDAQIQQEEYQEVTANEFLDFIQGINVEQLIADSTYYRATVNVVTQAGNEYVVQEPVYYPGDLLYGI